MVAMALLTAVVSKAALTNFVNFETAPVRPVALSPDGQTLAVCNLADTRLELFDVSSGVPVPSGSVPVGLDPVAARFATSNELWVVNHISSSISILDIGGQRVVATLDTLAGPSDVVFAGNPRRAWVSCSRTNAVLVVDPVTRTVVTNIAIDGERPRAMATSPDGSKVYVAIFESGNGTTIIGRRLTEIGRPPLPGPVDHLAGPHAGADPPPNSGTNFVPAIKTTSPGAPPRVSHIVRKNAAGRWMDDNNGDWTEWVSGTNAALSGRIAGWDLPDRDLAIIDTASLEVSYAHRLMNICMAIAVNPASGEISVVGTDATNERRFEPVLNGVFLRVNLALIDPLARTNRLRDLNPHLDYITRRLPQEQRALSLGDPRGIEWNAAGTRAYITGMGSRNLIVVDSSGHRVNPQPIELGDGPTGMALDEARGRLYVWNRFSSTLSVVDTSAGLVTTNVPMFDPTPDIVRKGRRHLYDTRKTSGLGIVSCASCHVDARVDRLAWDLGDPAGDPVTNLGFNFHPMKGPMVTQTFQDIITPTNFEGRLLFQQPLHWRGDRKNIEEFNPTFTNLMANDVELTTNEMAEFKEMLASIFFPPNFLRTFSNSLPTALPLPGHFGRAATNGGPHPPLPLGNARAALSRFSLQCLPCHGPSQGRGLINIINLPRGGTEGPFKTAQLRSLLDKVGMDGSSTNSRAGFGFMHDGRVDTLSRFLADGFASAAPNDQALADLIALLLCFTGSDLEFPRFPLAPVGFEGQVSSSITNPPGINIVFPSQDVPAATGRQVTFVSSNAPPLLNAMFDLALVTTSRVELVIRGKKEGRPRGWLLRRSSREFLSDREGELHPNLAAVIATAAPGNEFTAMLVPRGTGVRLALDRDGDGYFDSTELAAGSDAADPGSHPIRIVGVSRLGGNVTLTWESIPGARYAVEWRATLPSGLADEWNGFAEPLVANGAITTYTNAVAAPEPQRFYRVRQER